MSKIISPSSKKAPKSTTVAMATPVSVSALQAKLVDDAVEIAHDINGVISRSGHEVEDKSRELIRRMLLVRESFENEDDGVFNADAFWEFVEHRAGPVRVPPKNPWQRLAKACVPEGTKRPQVSKYGYVLAALVREEIASDSVIEEFDDERPVGDSERDYTGLDRFVRLHRHHLRGESGPVNPFMTMKPQRLRTQAEFLIKALKEKGLLNPQVGDVNHLMLPSPSEEEGLKI